MQHEHFKNVWQSLNQETQEKVLDLIAGGKGMISYESIRTFDILNSVSQNRHFVAKSAFYSELKLAIVLDEKI